MKRYLVIFHLFISSFSFCQQTDYVDFISAKADINFGDLKQKEVSGIISYEFEILKSTDSIYLDANNFKVIEYKLDSTISGKLYDGKHLIIKHDFKENSHHKLDVIWEASPKKAIYFIDWDYEEVVTSGDFDVNRNCIEKKQIWTQGQGKYTSNWLPSIDDMNDKIEFDLKVTFDKDYEVIANGKVTKKELNDSKTTWYYDMQQPMSSYLVALAIGKYDKHVEYSKRGISLEMYYYPEDSLKFEPTYRYTKQMFDFLEEEIGVAYPWQNYKQVPVKDFLYAGMENTSTTIFSDGFVVDSIGFVDKNYVNVNAHELAHQWFGDMVTETSGTHHWLQEGFATYYALLAERDVFGNDHYYWKLYEYAQELLEQDKANGSTSLLDPKSSSTTFYKKGAWVLHMLREQVGGDAFKSAVKSYLEKHQFKNVETDDFISEVEMVSGQNLDAFVEVWLVEESFDYDLALESLRKSNMVSEYLDITYEQVDSKSDFTLSSDVSDEIKSKIIKLVPEKVTSNVFDNSLKVRQTLAQTLTKIRLELKEDYETLLNDKSYLTIETALYNLWVNFPDERINYLIRTKGIQGFNDKNIRTLWLTLALVTDDFEPENKKVYFDELTDYTSPKYGFEIRRNAFQYLNQIQACDEDCNENLQQAAKHHSWQFSKFAKSLIKGK
jgi:aminopeptidase N